MESLPEETVRAPHSAFATSRSRSFTQWFSRFTGQLTVRMTNVPVLLVALLAISVLATAGCEWGTIGYNKGYAPTQPLPFSHELHAGQYKIQCLYCHSGVERSQHSPVPALNICMNCHMVVATDKPAIQKLTEAYNNNEPIPWVKVHMLPDHVKFNHEAHVAKFGAPQACHKCHGPVESMEVLYQNSSLSMGWCIECHRKPEHQAPVNCSTCHY